ncbi:MAG: penicillin acylase family protein [Gemmatimonadaceae bacterium]
MRRFTTVVSALSLLGGLWIGFRPTGPVPPLGDFLDPVHGIWSVGRTADLPAKQTLALKGLGAAVEVKYDARGVPHIFAKAENDAYRALGWVHARDRLFQMELTQRAVAGTMAELVGERALPLDRDSRGLGLAAAAEAKWAAIPAGSEARAAVESYMEGVNAYVRGMQPEDLPLEYRLLGRKPRQFNPVDTYYLLARMSQTLSYQQGELRFNAVEQMVGRAAAVALLPIDAPIQEPIEPVPGRRQARIAPTRFPAPELATGARIAEARRWRDAADLVASADGRARESGSTIRGDGVAGSNNWAVAPSRTASGFALLAGDPHLPLTLPSIWYEAHLVVEGGIDVYGVTLPLSPIIPIGFNRDVAWTATNTGNDVVDFYRETVNDSLRPTQYRLDGAWRALGVRVETYRAPSGRVIAVDTLLSTHRGPLHQTALGWVSVRWTAREVSDEGEAFWRAARTTSARDWYAAMERYRTPAQNFLVADRAGTIGIRSTGRYPIRPGSGTGNVVFDGSTSASDWVGDRPLNWYPQALSPAQGYLASANQQPMDPAVRPGYVGTDWPSPWRAMRINTLLRAHPAMTPDLMRQFQTDPRSEVTPFVMTALGEARVAAERAGTWTADDATAMAFLEAWDATFTPGAGGAVLFDALLSSLTRLTWDELVIPGENRRVATPAQMMLTRLLADPGSAWWDDRSTPDVREDRDQILLAALRDAWSRTRSRFGNDERTWKWSDARPANIPHLLRLPGFGREGLAVTGGPETLSPMPGGGYGASWRFVVELGPEIRAWGTYPGGQSGNPVSARYDDRLALWQRGELSELLLPRSPEGLGAAVTTSVLTFLPE